MRRSPTFTDILGSLEPANSRRVIERAVLANRIAKIAKTADAPLARRRAYLVKTRALEHGMAKFPHAFALASAEHGGRVLGIRFRHECALHVLARDLGRTSREWVRREATRIVVESRCAQRRHGARKEAA